MRWNDIILVSIFLLKENVATTINMGELDKVIDAHKKSIANRQALKGGASLDLGLHPDTMKAELKKNLLRDQLRLWDQPNRWSMSAEQKETMAEAEKEIDSWEGDTLKNNFRDGIVITDQQNKKFAQIKQQKYEASLGKKVVDGIMTTGGAVANAGKIMTDALKDVGVGAADLGSKAATGTYNAVTGAASATGSALSQAATTTGSAIGTAAKATPGAIGKAATSARDGIVSAASKTKSAAAYLTAPLRTRVSETYKDARDSYYDALDSMDEQITKVKQLDKASGGVLSSWVQEQQNANLMRMQKNAADTFGRADKMMAEMNAKKQQYQQNFEDNIATLEDNLNTFKNNLKTGFQPLEMTLIAGEGTDLDGNLIEPSSFEISMNEVEEPEVWASTGDESGDSPVSNSNSILDLLIKECYQGMAVGNRNQEVVDKNCLKADILTYRCEKPIDASFFIGVTFDISEGYNSQGFRGKLVKHWCRKMQRYKGQWDVPDGMHIQGVYETKVKTETFSSVSEYISAITTKSNTQTGDSSFKATRTQLDSRKSDTSSESSSASGGFGGFGGGGSSFDSKASASQNADLVMTSNKDQKKTATLNEDLTKTTTKTQKMVGEMSINVIRYEMFLREVKPNYIHEDFLNCFMMLPQSFYSPKAPEKFMDFIQRYGTHYVKAARFGGQLKVLKTKEITDTSTITDFRKEMQTQVNEIVGNAVVKARAKKGARSAGSSLQASASYQGFSAGGGHSESKSMSFEDSQESGSSGGSASATLTADGTRNVATTKEKKVMDSTILEVSGGTHEIATQITDLFSINFRAGLMRWLQSIPFYPKPFDFIFEPITKLLKHMVDDMIDDDMYQTCIVDKQEFHAIQRSQSIPCDTVIGQTHASCKKICINATAEDNIECPINTPRLLDCREVVQQKEKIKRKISALDTAITLYIKSGSLHPKNYLTIPVQAAGCTTAYRIGKVYDDFDAEFGESEEVDWTEAPFHPIQLQFNFKKFFFNNDDVATIFPNERMIMFFDSRDRRWYTREDIDDELLPSFASQAVPFAELKSQATRTLGEYKLVPRPIIDGDNSYVQIRTNKGLYVEVNLKNKDVHINERSVNAMKASSDLDVAAFVAEYNVTLDEMASSPGGEVVGFINPIIPNDGKVPFPCTVAWSNNQMYEATDDVQQCIKITVETTREYFFVMASSLTEPTSWIYVHQTQNDLCIHKLDNEGNDVIGSCAQRFEYMTSGQVENMPEQLYICIYRMDNLLSISLQRPSYSRLDRESTMNILTYNYVQQLNENIFPRYYAVGAGETKVRVKNIFMVEIESLQCQLPFKSQNIGGTFRCILECHPECSDKGCNRPDDPTNCLECKNSKYLARFPGKPDVPTCIPTCEKSEDLRKVLITDPSKRDPGIPGQKVCSQCHHECLEKCRGLEDTECEGDIKCVNKMIYEEVDGVRRSRCIPECPDGTYSRRYTPPFSDNIEYDICEPCPAGCKLCALGDTHLPSSGAVDDVNANTILKSCDGNDADCFDSAICLECADDYISAVVNITHVSCHTDRCPHIYQRRGDECQKSWRPIGYQDIVAGAIDDTQQFPAAQCRGDTGCTITVGKNYLHLGTADDFEKYKILYKDRTGDNVGLHADVITKEDRINLGGTPDVTNTHGFFTFQLAWKVDDCTVFILNWRQNFNPIRTYADPPAVGTCDPPSCLPDDKTHEIQEFKQVTCVFDDPALLAVKQISFTSTNYFINCPEVEVTKYNTETIDIGFGTGAGLGGLTRNLNDEGWILEANAIGLYTFGQMVGAFPVGGAIPAFKLDNTFYSSEMQLSVNDRRYVPLGWSQWAAFDAAGTATTCLMNTDCSEATIVKTRYCQCLDHTNPTALLTTNPTNPSADFDKFCQPCEGDTLKNEVCEVALCESSGLITSKTYYHHHCCEDSSALRIIAKNRFGNDLGFNGVYELNYDSTDDDLHEYLHLKSGSSKKIKREGTAGYYYWVLYDGTTEKLRSSLSKCPMNAANWGVDGIDWPNSATFPTNHATDPWWATYIRLDDYNVLRTSGPFPDLTVMCSQGRNTCPDTHKYSFNRGANCCISPFQDASQNLLTPLSTTCYGGTSSTDPTATGSIACDLVGGGNRRCRSNLDNIGTREFKALSSKKWNYEYKECQAQCGIVYIKADLQS